MLPRSGAARGMKRRRCPLPLAFLFLGLVAAFQLQAPHASINVVWRLAVLSFDNLSDKIGRKPIILGGMLLASLTYYPLYTALGVCADPKTLNFTMAVIIVVITVNYVGMTYGPIGAFLAEFFPSRIRYTSVSVPYHIGNGWAAVSCPSSPQRPTPRRWRTAPATPSSGP